MACPAPRMFEESIQFDCPQGMTANMTVPQSVLDALGAQAQATGRAHCAPCVPGSFQLLQHTVEPFGDDGKTCTLRVQLQVACQPRRRRWWEIVGDAIWKGLAIALGAAVLVFFGVEIIGALALMAARDPKKAGEIIRFAQALSKAA